MAGTVVICFTDIVGSTALLTRLGDERFDEVRREHFEALERQLDPHGGEVVKRLGDGLMISFASASDAVAAAVAMQQAATAVSRAVGEDVGLRVGISAGDATHEDDGDWYGTPVVEGARLCDKAGAGGILVSEVVRLLAGSRGGHEFRSVGDLDLKGLPETVGAAEVIWSPVATSHAVSLPGPLAPGEGDLPFAGRQEPTALLTTEWKAVAGGGCRIVMVAGEPGVGKTRLVAELARQVHNDGSLVLLGRSDEHVDAPYGPWREALRTAVRGLPDEVLSQHAADHGGELARLVPDLTRRVEAAPDPVALDPETERLLLFEAVTGLLAAASSEAPLLLVLDDLHWADRSSLTLLLHLLKADDPGAVLVVATYRDTDVDRTHPLSTVLADLRRIPGTTRLALSGLDEPGLADLLVSAGGHDLDQAGLDFATNLWNETEGNPFFVGEVLRHLTGTGALVQQDGRWQAGTSLDQSGLPEGVRDVIGRRLAVLPEATNEVLGVASVVGREFDVALVAEVAGQDVATILERLEPAEQARLLTEVPGRAGRYSFSHALVRTVLTEELGTNRRVRLHQAAGIALETRDAAASELAFHFGEAAIMGETDRAVRYATEAAEQALALVAPEAAVAFFRRALAAAELADPGDPRRAGLLLGLATALDAAGSFGEARDAAATAFETAAAGGDVDLACEAAVAYGGNSALFEVYGEQRGPAQLQEALALLPPGDSVLRVGLLIRLGVLRLIGPGLAGADTAQEAYDMADRLGDLELRARAAAALASNVRVLDPVECIRLGEEALPMRDAWTPVEMANLQNLMAEASLSLGDLDGFTTHMRATLAGFDASGLSGLPEYRGYHDRVSYEISFVASLISGRRHGLEAALETMAAQRSEMVLNRMLLEVGRAQLAHLRGHWDDVWAGWERTRAVAPAATAPYFGYIQVSGGLHDLRSYVDAWTEMLPLLPAWTVPANTGVRAVALRRLGDGPASAALRAEYEGYSGRFLTNGTAWFDGPFDTALGILATTDGQLDTAVHHLDQAVQQCDTVIASPTFGAIARLELATSLLLRNGHGDAARGAEVLARAREQAEQVGMPGWIERMDRLAAGDLEPWKPHQDR